MAPAPNFGVFLDFVHPFLNEIDFRVYGDAFDIVEYTSHKSGFAMVFSWVFSNSSYNSTGSLKAQCRLYLQIVLSENHYKI